MTQSISNTHNPNSLLAAFTTFDAPPIRGQRSSAAYDRALKSLAKWGELDRERLEIARRYNKDQTAAGVAAMNAALKPIALKQISLSAEVREFLIDALVLSDLGGTSETSRRDRLVAALRGTR